MAADAAYVVLIPLAGVIFSAAGRHPIAGIAAAFAGVSGGFSANLLPGQLDALLFGITEAAAESVLPAWDANIAGNAYFIVGMTFVFLPVIWFVTDKIIEPRLLPITPQVSDEPAAHDQRNPVRRSAGRDSGLKASGVCGPCSHLVWVFLCVAPGTPLM